MVIKGDARSLDYSSHVRRFVEARGLFLEFL